MILSTGIAEEVYGCGKEANMTTVHSLSSHPVLICLSTFAQNTHKISQHERSYRCSNSVCQQAIIIITVNCYRSIFCPVLLLKGDNGGVEMMQA